MIIECKCRKYKFKVPDGEIKPPGRQLKCEICSDEWYYKINLTKLKKNLDILEKINPSKSNINLKIKNSKNDFKFLFNILIFLTIFFSFYLIIMSFKSEILETYPNLKNFYESIELVSEIINSYFQFLKGLLSEKFLNL